MQVSIYHLAGSSRGFHLLPIVSTTCVSNRLGGSLPKLVMSMFRPQSMSYFVENRSLNYERDIEFNESGC
jgi:hypothetical protein